MTETPNLPTTERLDDEKIRLIRDMCARGCTDNEFLLLMHMSKVYHLDPLTHQIWAVKYPGAPAAIFCGRDGWLSIAHRDGQFDGMESGTRTEGDDLIGWCKVYRKDMSHPFCVEVSYSEYVQRNKQGAATKFWREKPKTMLTKVAEAQALRRAFNISGLYDEAEFEPAPLPACGPVEQTATIDGEPAEVTRLPGKCSRCGKHDPMIAAYREKYLPAFTAAKKVLPDGVCEECAKELWRG
ncbi:phage recombination protein Bet [Methanoculleus palmolei]|uniref:Phage recombination protein Bet n=1 Tax=Methanoculleus palmolei TaxID=72612 RepID=A0ABD8A674_9EURY|nr:phage recombination protein Bet [Methanoculleus palmolei]